MRDKLSRRRSYHQIILVSAGGGRERLTNQSNARDCNAATDSQCSIYVYIFLLHALCLLQSLKCKTQTNDDVRRRYQDAQAGGVEGRSEIDDSAPRGIDGERADGHISRPAQQVPDQPRPAPRPAQRPVLPVAHDIEVEGEAHVFCQFL